MSIHDWTRVDAGIFHAFHHGWIEDMSRALNSGVLPPDYYALPEQHAAGFGPDVLTLEAAKDGNGTEEPASATAAGGGIALLLSPPKARVTAETDMEFYRRRRNAVVVRHASGDRMVAVVEVVSPGNKAGRAALRSFVEKAAELLDHRIHLLILDLHPPTARDPQGIHGTIWEEITGQEYAAPAGKPLTLAAYESGLSLRAYVEPVAVGDTLIDMPLFVEPGAHVLVPLESTYERAFAAIPRRWRRVLEPAGPG
jgi:hypothetical protein